MYQQEPFPESLPTPPRIEDLHVRHERQTLRRLPRSRAVMFLVRTYMTPLVEMRDEKESIYALYEAVNAWPEEMAKYKGKNAWGDVFGAWCEEVLRDYALEEGKES